MPNLRDNNSIRYHALHDVSWGFPENDQIDGIKAPEFQIIR
jgi:hypothetical protein